MSNIGKLILGFFILATCFIGAMMIFAQMSLNPIGQMNIGNITNETLNASSDINQTIGLVSGTSSVATSAGIMMLFVLGALIIISAIALIAGRRHG
jgi:hypothetical protein